MERRVGPFQIFVGCFSAVGVVFTIMGVVVAIMALFYPRQFAVTLENILPTSTPLVITLPTQTPLPTPTRYTIPSPYPTYTPYPTHTPYPTFTRQPSPPTVTPSPTAVLGLLFVDSFDSGPRPEWRPISGNWRMVDGQYTATGSPREWVYSVVGDPNWKDYIIETDYSLRDFYGHVAILVRAGDASDLGLSFEATRAYDNRWRIWQDGEWATLATGEGSDESGHIRVEVRGSTFVASVDGLNRLEITDDSTTGGYVGVGIWCRGEADCPSFDNFQVTRIGE